MAQIARPMLFLLATLLSIASAAEWAVIVSGSSGYWNYRHQAGAAAAYQYYMNRGIPKDHIIVFMDKDVAKSEYNPFRGKLYSVPGMSDNEKLEGVRIDYDRGEITSSNVLNVLEGNRFSSKRVLRSAAFDTVFVSFFTYGAPGVITLPKDAIFGSDLMKTIEKMYLNKRYQELRLFVDGQGTEFLLSGMDLDKFHIKLVSPFTKGQPNRLLFCPPYDMVEKKHIGSCLSTDFSYRLYDGGNPDQPNPSSAPSRDPFTNDHIVSRVVFSNSQSQEDMMYEARSDFLYYRYRSNSTNLEIARTLKEEDNIHRLITQYNTSISSYQKAVSHLTQISEWNCYKRGVKTLEQLFRWNEYSFKVFDVIARMCEYNRKAF